MNEQKNSANKKQKNDYYFPVLLSQLLCCVFIVSVFFYISGTPSRSQLKAYYGALLEEDFFTVELGTAVSRLKEYISDEGAHFAVFGSRVEPYAEQNLPEALPESTTEEASLVPEADSQPAVQTLSAEAENKKTVPLRLSYKKEQQIIFPLYEGRYTSYFGERTDPITEGSDYHKGIDIGADEGDSIRAAYDGRVISVGYDERSGRYVFLEHEKDVVTFYCHCSEILVKKGEKVKQGDTIALVGSTGYSTGPHLHFEVRIKGVSVDPLPLLKNAA